MPIHFSRAAQAVMIARSSLRRSADDSSGNIAVIFALTLMPLMAVAGASVDYSRAIGVTAGMQKEIDAAALRIAAERGAGDDTIHGVVEIEPFSIASASNLTAKGRWISDSDFEITAEAQVPLSILSGLPGLPETLSVSTLAVARVRLDDLDKPLMVQLNHEAGDYNQIYAYCFRPKRRGLGNGIGPIPGDRAQMTLIADNGGSTYEFEMPHCEDGENLSFRLRNVRNARTRPTLWNDPSAEQYDHYSDTTRTLGNGNGANPEKMNFPADVNPVETVLCDTLDECKPVTEGGVIPVGRQRNPHAATKGCQPGKLIYYGWEDRPPPKFGSDRDYDDIRIILNCAETKQRTVLLVK